MFQGLPLVPSQSVIYHLDQFVIGETAPTTPLALLQVLKNEAREMILKPNILWW